MGRAKEMPEGLTREQRYAWVQAQMEDAARSPRFGRRPAADERVMADAPPVREPEAPDGVARWDVGHDNVNTARYEGPPHREGVALELPEGSAHPNAPLPERRGAPEVPHHLARPASLDGPRAPSFYPVEPWRPEPGVEVRVGTPTVVARRGMDEGGGGGAPERRPAGPAVRRSASLTSRTRSGGAPEDLLASVRAVSPEVADYLSSSSPPGGPAQDVELAAAQGQSARARLGAQLGRAGAMANEALTGTRVSDAWEGLEKQADVPVGNLLERRESARVQGRDARDVARHNREEDLYRPGSERSRTARTAALLRFGDRFAGMSREQFDALSAADVAAMVQGFERDRSDEGTAQRHRESMAAQAAGRRDAAEERTLRMELMQEERRRAADEKETAKKEREDEKDLQELQKRLSGVNEVGEDIRVLNEAIERGGDIPGFGVWDSWKMRNPVARALFASDDDVRVHSAATRLAGNENRAMTGLASSDQERAENMRRRGLDAGNTEEAAVQGLQTLARDAKNKHQNVEAGFTDRRRREAGEEDVVQRYQRNGGKTSADIDDPVARPTGRVRRDRNGVRWMEMSDGSARRLQ